MKYQSRKKALILLADGTIFYGKSVGDKEGTAFGEVCFNTGMTGYQEIFTDPSYFGQLMVTTNAHIGNYGTNTEEVESESIKISGLICRNFSYEYSRPKKYFNFLDEKIKSGGDESVYKHERIVVRQIGKTPVVGLCKSEIVTSNTMYNLYMKDNDFELLYILAILNSKLIKSYWNFKYSDGKQLFPKIKGYQLKSLPIPTCKNTPNGGNKIATRMRIKSITLPQL